jgi:hypothetical protein
MIIPRSCFSTPDIRVVPGGLRAWVTASYPVERGMRRAWSVERQVRFIAGTAALFGVVLFWVIHPGCSALAACLGAGLAFSAVTDTCGLALVGVASKAVAFPLCPCEDVAPGHITRHTSVEGEMYDHERQWDFPGVY